MKKTALLAVGLGLLLGACHPSVPPGQQKTEKTTTLTGVAMTVPYRITIGKVLDATEREKIENIVAETFSHIDSTYNNWNPDSEISRVNALEEGQAMILSSALEAFLENTGALVALSGGRFDPTIAPIQKLWKEHLELGKIPSDEAIAALAPAIGWDKIEIYDGTLKKADSRTEVDLCGIVKGHAIDLLVEKIGAAGFPHVYVDWGGEIRTAGEHPDGRAWKIYIAGLSGPQERFARAALSLHDRAMATSGDYLQYWVVSDRSENGAQRHFFHIVNPLTLKALEIRTGTIGSASVAAKSCTLADALATTLMTFSDEAEAEVWVENVRLRYPDAEYWLESRQEPRDVDISHRDPEKREVAHVP